MQDEVRICPCFVGAHKIHNHEERIKSEGIDCPVNYAKNVSVHILRHTALSHYAEILTVAEVQSIAGHSNSQTTDKYIHIDREQMKQKLKVNSRRFN